jgi:hypothetical protein
MAETNSPEEKQVTKKDISDAERQESAEAKKTQAADAEAMFEYTEGADCTFPRKE